MDTSISEALSSKKIIHFSDIDEHQDVIQSIHTQKKIVSSETEHGSVKDPLSIK